MTSFHALINDLGLLKVSGPDAARLLQGQLTCDVEKASQTAIPGAHCNPQGRLISLFWLFKKDDDFYLAMPRDMVDTALQALKKYAVFYKAVLTDASGTLVLNRHLDAKTAAAMPRIYPQTSGIFLPHELCLDIYGAISFDKGCYTGQEIIARMHYRGKLKKRLYQAETATRNPPMPGSDIYNTTKSICGTLVDCREQAPAHYVLWVILEESSAQDALTLKTNEQITIIGPIE